MSTIERREDGTLIRVPADPFSPGEIARRNNLAAHPSIAGILGPSPRAFDSVLSGLLRAYRQLDADEETRQADAYSVNRERDARLRVLSELIAWVRPAVEAEKARWAAEDAEDTAAKDWARLRAAGLDETELRQLAGDR